LRNDLIWCHASTTQDEHDSGEVGVNNNVENYVDKKVITSCIKIMTDPDSSSKF